MRASCRGIAFRWRRSVWPSGRRSHTNYHEGRARERRPASMPERRTMMQRQVMWLFLLATVLVPALVGAVTEADFEAKTTQNLLNLCTAPPSDPYYREAIHFCHGYLVGAYQ